jgi:hypothetical protein
VEHLIGYPEFRIGGGRNPLSDFSTREKTGVIQGRKLMKLSALIYLLVVAFAISGCVTPPAQTSQRAAFASASATPACDQQNIRNGNDFVSNKVLLLSPGYDPTTGVAPGASQILGPVAQNSPYRKDLSAAFRIAPDFFKDKLCGVTYAFVVQCANATQCTPEDAIRNSWGLREWQGAKSGKFIATSAALWQLQNSALPFHQYKNKRLALLLQTISPGLDLSQWPSPPVYSPATPNNNGEVSVLGALAHEMGHVLWYDAFVPNRGGNIDLTNFCNGFYTQNSWSGVNVTSNRWINFGDLVNGETHNPDYITPIRNDLNASPPNFAQAGEDLNQLFSDQGLTGTLAAVSPDEDFVETYMLYVLLSSKLNNARQFQKLIITITGNGTTHTRDVADIFSNKSKLLTKMSCFGQLPSP